MEDTKDLELPAYLDGLGNPVTINPPTGDSWGYERMSGGPEKWDFGKAVAVNNSGQILCQAQILRPDDPMGIVWDFYSFIYKDGVSGPLKLPGWATDINDLGEVVGGFPGGNETWLYLPSDNYGLAAGLHTIPFTREVNDVTEVRPKIGNKGMIVWAGENIGVRQVWVAGTVYPFADLFPDENFEVHDALDLNNAHQFVAETLEDDPQFGTYPSWRIISVPTSITVNTTSDLSDANPTDGVVDVDLGTPGNQVSLRAAIDEVLGGRVSEIKFKIPGSGVPRIVLNSELPPITRGVTIDGTTQPGAKMVEIQGNPTLDTGLILAASSCAVKGMSINGFTKKNSIWLKLVGEG
ncbi:MAG: hypothetical protein KDL87_18155, partial [Verrucomicrobiae bacterium]|nr:hypothetical protein [Verrucomicrobiae bacterium]